MKHLKFSLVLILILSSCAHLPKAAEIQKTLSVSDVSLLNELERIKTTSGEAAWPGYSKAKIQMILVSRDAQWSLGISQPPQEYKTQVAVKELNSALQPVYVTSSYFNETGNKEDTLPTTLFNAYSSQQTGSHFREPVYFVKTLDDYRDDGDPMDAEEWIHISLHELFHTFQDQFVRYNDEFMKSVTVPYKKTIREDQQHIERLGPELQHLAAAACASTRKEARAEILKALELRKKRWAWVTGKYKVQPDHWERYEAWAEGTAHYVEHKIMADWRRYAESTLIGEHPHFNQFSKFKGETKKLWCAQISETQKRSYWCSIGFAYALALDRLMPDWKSQPIDDRLFFDSYFIKLGLLKP